jgi:hypothetical protein
MEARMSWRNRETGHLVSVEADFSRLADLPAGVGFRVYSRKFKQRTIWVIGTGTGPRGKKWNPGDHPFAEAAPLGSPQFIERIRELARPFCDVIDRLAALDARPAANPVTSGLPPAESRFGELSLGQQMTALLGVPVLSFLSDPDNGDELACINEPGAVRRIACQCAGLVLEFVGGVLEVSPMCPATVAGIPKVRSAASPRPYNKFMHGLVVTEVDAFAGIGFADADQVLPSVGELPLLGERTSGGKYRRVA